MAREQELDAFALGRVDEFEDFAPGEAEHPGDAGFPQGSRQDGGAGRVGHAHALALYHELTRVQAPHSLLVLKPTSVGRIVMTCDPAPDTNSLTITALMSPLNLLNRSQ